MSPTTTEPTTLDADQLALVNACKEAKGRRDAAIADAQSNFSDAVRAANEEFVTVVDRARRRVKTTRLADAIGINRQNLHRLIRDFGGAH